MIRLVVLTSFLSGLLLLLVACTPPLSSVTSVHITGGDHEVGIGESIGLNVEVAVQGDADDTVNWTSSDEAVATIELGGELTGLAVGTSRITATSVFDATKSSSVMITVTAACQSLDRVIEVPDVNLRAALLDALDNGDGPVLCEGMRELGSFTARTMEIQNLQGLQHAANLTNLNLGSNEISDVTPLANLMKLTRLHLPINDIRDLTPLEGLTDLEILYVGWNEISDITPLENLAELKDVSLSNNDISDIEPLENHTNLRNVYLTENCLDIADGSPARVIIAGLEAEGASVVYDPQRTCGSHGVSVARGKLIAERPN